MRFALVAWWLLCSSLAVAACSSTPGNPVGASCDFHEDCESGVCADVCVARCVDDSDCAAGVCAGQSYGGAGAAYCVATCTGAGTDLRADWYCLDGAPERCSDSGETSGCVFCGCNGADHCDWDTGACLAPSAVGEPCFENADCASRNCGAVADDASICFVAAGAECDGTNCGECVEHDDGSTSCLQACDSDGTCGDGDHLCWGSRFGDDGFYCRPTCASFGGTCPDGLICRELLDRDYRSYFRCVPESVDIGPASFGCDTGVSDACGTCDDDPSNDCTPDCAGTYGGAATVDPCGTCDADPTNDCTADCEGTFGGPATVDPCGTCDANPSNDGHVDPCGVCDADATNDCVLGCTYGRTVRGGCWFVGERGASCASTCYRWGGTYSEQTRRVAGSDGTLDACAAVIDAWSVNVSRVSHSFATGGVGCAVQPAVIYSDPGVGQWRDTDATTSSAAETDLKRLCACEF